MLFTWSREKVPLLSQVCRNYTCKGSLHLLTYNSSKDGSFLLNKVVNLVTKFSYYFQVHYHTIHYNKGMSETVMTISGVSDSVDIYRIVLSYAVKENSFLLLWAVQLSNLYDATVDGSPIGQVSRSYKIVDPSSNIRLQDTASLSLYLVTSCRGN